MNFWRELLRRKVLRTAGLYVVGAWLAIQVGDIAFPTWGLPEASLRFVFIAAAACFPLALVFGWFFDVSSRGIQRTPPADGSTLPDARLRPVDYAILIALVAIGLGILFGSLDRIRDVVVTVPEPAAPSARPANSIAVLPFTNLDTNPDSNYFSDGITEEILHRLSTLRVLHVLASTSSFAFRDSEDGPASISEKLGVRYLLQGSVRREGDNVRITARLVDESGFQVWSDSFDRQLDGIFVIQTEIAGIVAGRIVNEIVPQQELPAGRTTRNMAAYNAYLQGRAFFDARTPGWRAQANAAYSQAIELDPGYAPPYAGLASLVVNSERGPHWEEARQTAQKSLQLDPELPLGHAVLGLAQAVLGNPDRGLESLHRAIELDPSLAIAYTWMALPLQDLGRDNEALAMQQRGLEVDPLNPILLVNVSEQESRNGHFERAEQLLLRLTKLPKPAGHTYSWLHELYDQWSRYADAVDAAQRQLRLTLENGLEPDFEILIDSYAKLGMREEVAYWFDKLRSQWPPESIPIHVTRYLATLGDTRWLADDLLAIETGLQADTLDDAAYLLSYGGLARIQSGNIAGGIEWLERGIVLYQQDMRPDDPPQRIDYSLLERNWPWEVIAVIAEKLAYAYRESGRAPEADEAIQFLRGYQASMEGLVGPGISEERAIFHALSDDSPGALEHLQQALGLGWANYYRLTQDPLFAGMIKTPGFKSLLAEAERRLEQQRAEVVKADPGQEFRRQFEAVEAKIENILTN